ncbi:hypothetical protein ROHU_033015 [Labeo rohita]|uniref:Uncharacterized protein n=1 Tax=Labeo rohita TaxID=84645 RepID=A0A498LD11_LABRO|nr:hypothetical protein ROHU_033015 [Labeo rohita]
MGRHSSDSEDNSRGRRKRRPRGRSSSSSSSASRVTSRSKHSRRRTRSRSRDRNRAADRRIVNITQDSAENIVSYRQMQIVNITQDSAENIVSYRQMQIVNVVQYTTLVTDVTGTEIAPTAAPPEGPVTGGGAEAQIGGGAAGPTGLDPAAETEGKD